METLVFGCLAVTALTMGWLVFVLGSMARVTFALLAALVCVGGVTMLLGLPYLGVVLVLMTVMEMVIMAVFMIAYMMNPAGLMPMSMVHNRYGAMAIAAGVFLALAAGILLVPWPARPAGEPPADTTFQLGEALMGTQMLTMTVLGLVLLSTMVAAIVLATARGRYDRYGDRLERRVPRDPAAGGTGGAGR
ncbi:NADH-quinone oxidoreductase subunit J family protein [Streptomyces aidingensis]|uniref:NADH-quinone oxidoreductase subunit J n=1 Tax=Streptomyces aidingensis TaxID=910347 RepID=A0A1I1F825_9ACTN|nr:NADH-quinone oxidoreductase subunit J [Streptomyces aidingensis]SFB95434.1 NADH:ubiquinone oxidoreductase subunit 6 (chain J) [Streptomyces aidingensis]